MRGRNSDNERIRELLGWAPPCNLKDGLRKTYDWIKVELEKDAAAGIDSNFVSLLSVTHFYVAASCYASSSVVKQIMDDEHDCSTETHMQDIS